jgi:hypothetical protein
MNFFKKLLSNNSKGEIDNLMEGYCPNCWGDQEYADEVREKFRDPQIDVNNGEANYAFVQDFIVTHLTGIKLKSTTSGVGCSRCKLKNQ